MGGAAHRAVGVVRAAILAAAFLAPPASAQWSPEALDAHVRARAAHLRYVRARHDPARLPSQRDCFELIASQAGALVRALEDRAAMGAMPEGAIDDANWQLDALASVASETCTRTREVDGNAQVELWRDPFEQRMRRDRVILRLSARMELAPRVRRAGYGIVPALAVRAAFGGFVVPWLRLEAIATAGWPPGYGPFGSAGARAMITAPWSLFRVGVGLAASIMVAADRLVNIEFGWAGFQLELPVEVAWEISESFGLTLVAAPIYTQAGEVRLSPQAIAASVELLAEIVL